MQSKAILPTSATLLYYAWAFVRNVLRYAKNGRKKDSENVHVFAGNAPKESAHWFILPIHNQ